MIKIILPAHKIPLGETVTKLGGKVKYILRDKIRVFDQYGNEQVYPAGKGARFLTNGNGNVNAISANKELVWNASDESFDSFYNER